jgi:formylmethanofuran dehydrogenase subunit E
VCGSHYAEGHSGRWKECQQCRKDFETEMYVYYGTNEYNFEKLENSPVYEPARCSKCGEVIVLSEGGYSQRGNEYWCGRCTYEEMADLLPLASPRTSHPTAIR